MGEKLKYRREKPVSGGVGTKGRSGISEAEKESYLFGINKVERYFLVLEKFN